MLGLAGSEKPPQPPLLRDRGCPRLSGWNFFHLFDFLLLLLLILSLYIYKSSAAKWGKTITLCWYIYIYMYFHSFFFFFFLLSFFSFLFSLFSIKFHQSGGKAKYIYIYTLGQDQQVSGAPPGGGGGETHTATELVRSSEKGERLLFSFSDLYLIAITRPNFFLLFSPPLFNLLNTNSLVNLSILRPILRIQVGNPPFPPSSL